MNTSQNLYVIILITLIIFIYKLLYEPFKNVLVLSQFDNQKYSVQDTFDNPEEAANQLSLIRGRIDRLLSYLNNQYPENSKVSRLIRRFNPDNLREALDEEDSTSFTINKGEEIHLCLRSKKGERNLHDPNLLIFVVIHELAHVMSVTIGHNDEFKENFEFLLNEARDAKIYYPINYQDQPKQYCGLKVKNNPLFK